MHAIETMRTDTEPDYRFTLANERTFLAWIRTALALLAGGVAIHQLLSPTAARIALTVVVTECVLLAVMLPIGALLQWRWVQRCMRRSEPLPSSRLIPGMAFGVCVIAGSTTAVLLR
jgi:putative membrane protein